MKKLKLIPLILLCLCLIPFSSLAQSPEAEGSAASREEVIYANLSAEGAPLKVYAVNVLNMDRSGTVKDYGSFSSVENLTDASGLSLADDEVTLTASEGRFYYRGNMEKNALPWLFSVEYRLDGVAVSPEQLHGKSGEAEIEIAVEKNNEISDGYYENYMLQLQLQLNTEIFSNISAKGALIAGSGRDKIVSFTIMAGSGKACLLTASVSSFALPQITATGLPMSVSVDTPDLSELTEQLQTLTEGISSLAQGASQLKEGIESLSGGMLDLQSGSASVYEALSDLSQQGDGLVYACQELREGLSYLAAGMAQLPELAPSAEALNQGLSQLTQGIFAYVDGIKQLASAYGAIDAGIGKTAAGASALETGGNALSQGAAEMREETSDLPSRLADEVDSLISSFDKSDFQAPSFTSPKNQNTQSVQFIIKIG